MTAQNYGPQETWPQHQNKFWRGPLDEARKAGWSLRHLPTGHDWGFVSCPAGECTMQVDRTATGSETKALELRKDVRSCRHGHKNAGPGAGGGGGSKVAERRADCERLLTVAEQCLDGGEQHLADLTEHADAHDAFDHVAALTDQLEAAETTLEHVHAQLGRSLAAATDAALEAIDALGDEPDPADVAQAADEAAERIESAQALAGRLNRPGLRQPLDKRAAAASERVSALRAGLLALKERLGLPD